ncbi:MAG: hypothetical protein H6585_03505 [Flavobacteriales bacterium]|nr:hypothetical protein [Flavobacteriales bacterium]MCB9447394.1 hypothetical protein [Flavobacteriales bacterium]
MSHTKTFLYLLLLLTATGCDPAMLLYVSNESSQEKVIEVFTDPYNPPSEDSIRLFPSSEKLNLKTYVRATTSTPITKDAMAHRYTFNLQPGMATLLQPATIGTPIIYIVTEQDTTFFICPRNTPREHRFQRIRGRNYISTIH